MAKEIERKFLTHPRKWSELGPGEPIRQGYLSTVKERTVRARTVGDKGFVTIKGINTGTSRDEYEYEIPFKDAVEILDNLCEKPLIEKTRYRIPYAGNTWEVDEFAGVNRGLTSRRTLLLASSAASPHNTAGLLGWCRWLKRSRESRAQDCRRPPLTPRCSARWS